VLPFLLGLGSDVDVYFIQRSNTILTSIVKATLKRKRASKKSKGMPRGRLSSALNELDEGKWWLCRVQNIQRKVGNKWGFLKHPIDTRRKPHVE
jgi:hypothetical protein